MITVKRVKCERKQGAALFESRRGRKRNKSCRSCLDLDGSIAVPKRLAVSPDKRLSHRREPADAQRDRDENRNQEESHQPCGRGADVYATRRLATTSPLLHRCPLCRQSLPDHCYDQDKGMTCRKTWRSCLTAEAMHRQYRCMSPTLNLDYYHG